MFSTVKQCAIASLRANQLIGHHPRHIYESRVTSVTFWPWRVAQASYRVWPDEATLRALIDRTVSLAHWRVPF